MQRLSTSTLAYLSVWHMNDPLKDEVGTTKSMDTAPPPFC
jgi:hypothetical protein